MRVRSEWSLVLLSVLAGCTVTNTGNPHDNGGTMGGDAPKGIELVRSKLEREEKPNVSAADRARFAADNREFAFDLYGKVKDQGDNVFFSPYSISTALAMTYAGAETTSEQEMAATLHFTLPEPTLHAAFNATDIALRGRATELNSPESKGDGFKLQLTNALFGNKSTVFVPALLDTFAVNYGAGMYRADFEGNPDRERMAINDWVFDKTEQRIEELLPPMSISVDTVLVLVNAIYFKAAWLTKFDKAKTESGVFHAPGGDKSVQMMHATLEKYRYVKGEGYAALELPYISNAVRAMLLLPDEGKFAEVEGRLDDALFEATRKGLAERTVDTRIPRFKYEAEFELKKALQDLGMRLPFQAGASDLTGIGGKPGDYYIDQVYHKAFVALNEEGTEAAAATAVVVNDESASEPATFTADRPFLFFIYDEPTGTVLFVGRVNTPSE